MFQQEPIRASWVGSWVREYRADLIGLKEVCDTRECRSRPLTQNWCPYTHLTRWSTLRQHSTVQSRKRSRLSDAALVDLCVKGGVLDYNHLKIRTSVRFTASVKK